MNEQSSLPFLVNFILGLILWFGLCSDYSWDNAAANADENTHNFLSWADNETLHIKETVQELKLDWIEWEVPAFIVMYIELVCLLQKWF